MDIQKIQQRNSFMSDKLFPILHSLVKSYIVEIRQHPVIVDADVAALYGVETKRVNEAVKNNPDKFPEDYMFVLTSDELKDLRSKISTTNLSAKSRSLPKAFTEKGLYMLATILKSQRAKRIREPQSPDPKTGTWLSEQMSRNIGTVSRWMTNKVQTSVEQFYDIARHLDVDVKELLVSSK
jgi:hypothetical protein